MRDFSGWSVYLGRWYGVHVRLHVFFLLFAVFTLFLSTREPADGLLLYGVLGLGLLFLSVLAHEVAHCFAAFRVGGSAEQIVIGPVGGLAQPHVPHEPQHELIASLAGPLANLTIWLMTAPLLLAADADVLGLLNPLKPNDLVAGSPWLVALKLTFWINWLLLVVNFLPATPLAGWRVLRSILWSAFDYRTAVYIVARVAIITAFCMCVIAVFMRDVFPNALVPAWVPLVILAMCLFFSARQELARLEDQDSDDDLFSYDFSQGYTSLERAIDPGRRGGPSRLRRWLESRRLARRRRQQVVEQDEERQVDEILARLHADGMNGISAKERALLNRVSVRYRNRQQS